MERGVATAKVDPDPGQTWVVDASKLAFVVGVIKPAGRDTTGSGRHTTPPARYFYPATHETGVAISAAAKTPTHITDSGTRPHFCILRPSLQPHSRHYPIPSTSRIDQQPVCLARTHGARELSTFFLLLFGLGYTPISARTTATREWWAWVLGWARASFLRTDMMALVMVDIKGQHTEELLRFNKLSNRGTDGEMVISSCKKRIKTTLFTS